MSQVTIDQAMQMALQHHQAGRLQEAEQLYRQVLSRVPEHAPALHNLGLIAHQLGRNDIAVELIRRAIVLRPRDAEACHNLGLALGSLGQLEQAIAAYRQAISLRPELPEMHSSLGNALKSNGMLDEAIAAYRQAIALRPTYAEALSNLGAALADIGQLEEAIAAYRQAISHRPDLPEAYNNLGKLLNEIGQVDEAIDACSRAVALRPGLPEGHSNLGNALRDKGRLDDAIAAYRRAINLRPQYAQAHSNLGTVLVIKGLFDEAIDVLRKAITIKPSLAEAHNNLANALAGKGQLDEAVHAYRQAIALKPGNAEAHSNLGNALKDKGELDDAIAAYRRAIALNPRFAQAHSNLVYTLHFHAACDGRAISEELARWNERHARPVREFRHPHQNDPDPDRRLKIGYVSADFRDHVVGRNLLPLFREHDRGRFDVYGYCNVLRPDELTAQFRSHAQGWRSLVGLSDEQSAQLVREDRIDILVDLTLHMAHNRLLVFARKPAPVQVTFAGYPGSTGLDTIDYRLSDPHLDPPGRGDEFYSEESIRLPDTFWCYDPAVMTEGNELGPRAGALPALSSGQVTFGCLNNFCKINDRVLALWARVLKAAEGSRLILMAAASSARRRTLEALGREGIDPARIEFVALAPIREYLRRYSRIDIGLDTFPYNGHTTSLDALWMGVPVVSLAGKTVVGRAGLSQLTNLGLSELVATSEDQYVRIAMDLARDLPRLSALRAGLRQRMRQSPLTDAPRFARNVEAAYRDMWRRWAGRGLTRR